MITTTELTRAEWAALLDRSGDISAMAELAEEDPLRDKLRAMSPEQFLALAVELREVASCDDDFIDNFLASKPACSSNFMMG